MNTNLALFGSVILLLLFSLCGCTEQNQNNQDLDDTIISEPLEIFCLTLDDLPKGYAGSEYKYKDIQNINPNDFFGMHFSYEDPINDTGYPWIGVYLFDFSNLNQAKQSMQIINNEFTNTLDETKKSNIPLNEQFGEETIFNLYVGTEGKYYKYDNVTFSSIQYRIKNVVTYIFIEGISSDYIQMINTTGNYADIIENRILEVIN